MNIACKIIEAACSHFGVTCAQLEGPSRKFQWPRLIAMALCYRHTDFQIAQIGILFNRTHGSIINADRSVARAIAAPRDRADVETVKRLAGI